MKKLFALMVTAVLTAGCWSSETQYIAPDQAQGLDALVGTWRNVAEDPADCGVMEIAHVQGALLQATVFPTPGEVAKAEAQGEDAGPETFYFYAMNAPGTAVYVMLAADELGPDGPPRPDPNTQAVVYDQLFYKLDGERIYSLEPDDLALKARLSDAGARVREEEWGLYRLSGDAATIRTVIQAFMRDPKRLRVITPEEYFERVDGDSIS